MPKTAFQILLGFLMLAVVTVACNNKKEGDKKETASDTMTLKPTDQVAPATVDTPAAPTDTVKKKPVKDPNN